jgi:hypothetical protein
LIPNSKKPPNIFYFLYFYFEIEQVYLPGNLAKPFGRLGSPLSLLVTGVGTVGFPALPYDEPNGYLGAAKLDG